MSQNPYEPPTPASPVPSDRPEDTALRQPWYRTTPADWERTASMCWIAGIVVLLVVGFSHVPRSAVQNTTVLPLIPGPQAIGSSAYMFLAVLLATLPAALCASLHRAAMTISKNPLYRRLLCIYAAISGILLTGLISAASHFFLIR